MDIGLDHYSSPLFTPSYLSECDVDLVKKTLTGILHSFGENTDSLETSKLANVLNNYIETCNNAFLASERIRFFLLSSFIASTIISFITLAIVPISTLSICLVCILSLLLLSANFFILFNQTHGYHQENGWDALKKYYSEYTQNLYPKKFKNLTHQREKTTNLTTSFCLFTHQKKLPDFKCSVNEDSLQNENYYAGNINCNAP